MTLVKDFGEKSGGSGELGQYFVRAREDGFYVFSLGSYTRSNEKSTSSCKAQ